MFVLPGWPPGWIAGLPARMRWKDIVVIGCAASIGFTVALFVSTVAFGSGENLDAVKMGSLLSFSGILLTIAVAKLVRVRSSVPEAEET